MGVAVDNKGAVVAVDNKGADEAGHEVGDKVGDPGDLLVCTGPVSQGANQMLHILCLAEHSI